MIDEKNKVLLFKINSGEKQGSSQEMRHQIRQALH
jgi:hypothetical protein